MGAKTIKILENQKDSLEEEKDKWQDRVDDAIATHADAEGDRAYSACECADIETLASAYGEIVKGYSRALDLIQERLDK